MIPAAFARGEDAQDPESAWWIFKGLQDAASDDPPHTTGMLREGWAALEEEIEAERPQVEAEARAAALADEPDRAAEIVSDFMARTAEQALKHAETLRARIA